MNSFINVLMGNLLLNKGPQDFACSQVLMKLCLGAYFVTGIPGLMITADFVPAIFAMALDVMVLLAFIYLCLQAFSKSERFVQSVIGLACIGAFFQLLVLPLIINFDASPEAAEQMLGISILLLLVVSWNLAAYAHLFKEAFGVRLPAAIALTICYIVMNLLARKIFFPALA